MKRLLLILVVLQCLYLGFIYGKTKALKEEINKSNACIEYVLNTNINLDSFFGIKTNSLTNNSLMVLSYSAVALKYQYCMWR